MNFIVTGYDFTDVDALDRRMKAREAHMANIVEMKNKGQILFAAAMTNDEGNMCGSTMILEMPSRQAVDDYLKLEAYVVGKVWETVEVVECKVPPLFR